MNPHYPLHFIRVGIVVVVMTRFKVIVDLGEHGIVSEEANGNVANALKMAYEKCKEHRVNPQSVSVVQVQEGDTGKWTPAIPSRS